MPKPLIVAHRGVSGKFPENTLLAIRKGIEHGVDFVEIDVQYTKDGEIVVIHDASVDRTTGASGKVKSFSLKEIQDLDAGSFKAPEFAGEKIPTLEEVLDLFVNESQNGTKLLIEIKFNIFSWESGFLTPYKKLGRRVAEMVKAKGAQHLVVIQSFLEEYLLSVRKVDPSIPLHLLVFPWRSLSSMLALDFDSYNPSIRFVSKSFIDAVHKAGKKVIVWTVDDDYDLHFCLDAGVDGIITNYPVRARKFAENFKPGQPAPPQKQSHWSMGLLLFCIVSIIFLLTRGWKKLKAKLLDENKKKKVL